MILEEHDSHFVKQEIDENGSGPPQKTCTYLAGKIDFYGLNADILRT
jgi:hypothetical protein